MDIFAHALWANLAAETLSRKKKAHLRRPIRAEAMLGGVLPDFIPFVPYLVTSVFGTGGLLSYALARFGEEWGTTVAIRGITDVPALIPPYVYDVYGYTHSGLVWLAVAAAAYLLVRRVPFWVVGWGTHIALDIFTHDAGHFPTRILYPLSEVSVNATPWSNPVVFACTYVALLVCYLAVYNRHQRS